MKRYLNIVLLCMTLSSCMAQNRFNKSNLLLEKVYENQLVYYNQKIDDKDNYISILNFAKQGRNQIANKASNMIESGDFIVMEGFSPGWGKFVGLIWSDKVAYAYRKLPSKKLYITKVNLKTDDIKKATGIEPYILDKVKRWDINYISGLKGKIGMRVLDGYNFIATKVTHSEVEKDSKIETIAFEQFVDEK